MCVRLYAVICYDVPSFDFLLYKCCKSGVTAKNQPGFVVKIRRFPSVIFTGSTQLGAGRDVVVHHQKMELFLAISLVDRRQEHATGVDPHHGSRREIGDGDQGLSDQFFRLIISMNSGKNDAVSAGSVVQDELQKLLGLRNSRALRYLYSTEIRLAEGIEIDLLLKERLNLHV